MCMYAYIYVCIYIYIFLKLKTNLFYIVWYIKCENIVFFGTEVFCHCMYFFLSLYELIAAFVIVCRN